MEAYVTLEEAAELEGLKYKSMSQNIIRNQDKFRVKKEKSAEGGKERVLVAVSSLSKSARNAWKEREKLRSLTEAPPQEDGANPPDIRQDAPWYVGTDIEWYMANYKEHYYKGVELRNVIRKFLQYDDRGRTQYAEEFSEKYLGKNKRTLYRYLESYNEAAAWADRLGKEDGCDYEFFTVLALCRKPKQTGMFPSFTPEVKQAVKNIWFNKDFAANQGTKEMVYEKLQELADINRWEYIPSYQSVVRYINWLMTDGNMGNAHYLAGNGMKAYKNRVLVKAQRDTGSLQVMEIVMGDEHTFDCWVSYTMPNGKSKPVRPVLVAWIDVRSRRIMAPIICEHANSQILKQSLLKLLYQYGLVPKYLYIDNGKDYTGFEMTGRNRKERHGNELAFDEDVRGFYKSIGIIDDHRAKPYEAWNKAEIERSFRTVVERFTRWMGSYVGTLTGSKTAAKIPKDIKKLHETGKLLTMEEFYQKFEEWLDTRYDNRNHAGLKKQGEPVPTPKEVFENADRYVKAPPPKSYATILMMKAQDVFVRNIGIVRGGYTYMADELTDYINQKVNIRYDPDDLSRLYVFDRKGNRICEAVSQELLQFGQVSEKTIEHFQRQNRQIKRDQARLEEARIPFEQINDQYTGFSSTAGGIDLMVEGKPKAKKGKMVSFPDSALYRENPDLRGRKQEDGQTETPYLDRNAEKALQKLRAMEG